MAGMKKLNDHAEPTKSRKLKKKIKKLSYKCETTLTKTLEHKEFPGFIKLKEKQTTNY